MDNEVPEKKKQVIVNAPFFTSRPEKIPNLERYRFFKISGKIGGYFSDFMILTGAILCLFSSYYILTFAEISLRNPHLTDAMLFLGITNIICGLFLLATQ